MVLTLMFKEEKREGMNKHQVPTENQEWLIITSTESTTCTCQLQDKPM